MSGHLFRFAAVGAANTLATWAAYAALAAGAGLPAPLANAIAWGGGMALSFLGNRSWSFRASGSAALPQLARFLVVAGSSVVVSTLIVAMLVPSAGFVVAQLAATGLTMGVVFGLYRSFVFRVHAGAR